MPAGDEPGKSGHTQHLHPGVEDEAGGGEATIEAGAQGNEDKPQGERPGQMALGYTRKADAVEGKPCTSGEEEECANKPATQAEEGGLNLEHKEDAKEEEGEDAPPPTEQGAKHRAEEDNHYQIAKEPKREGVGPCIVERNLL